MTSRRKKIVLGFAHWGEKIISTQEMIGTIQDAVNIYGIHEIDCAPHYGNGARESTLGVALLDLTTKPKISTKAGRIINPNKQSTDANGFLNPSSFSQEYDYTEAGILESFKQSQLRLHTKIHTYYLHDLDPSTHGKEYPAKLKEFMESGYKAFEKLKREGMIQLAGIGTNDVQSCMDMIYDGRFHIDRIMLAGCYNLLNYDVLNDFFPLCAKKNIEVYLAAPYCGGVLSGEKGNNAYKYQEASSEILLRVAKIQTICDRFNVSLAHAAMQFVLMHPQAKCVVVGARTTNELLMSLEYASNSIDPHFWEVLKTQMIIPYQAPTDMPNSTSSLL